MANDSSADPTPPSSADLALTNAIVTGIDADTDRRIDLRRSLHRIPELNHDEHRTTGLIVEQLQAMGLEQRPAGSETGAAFVLDGGRPGRTVLMRADIDGLPITEDEHGFTSELDGAMHACGHDGHTAMLLSAARVLADHAQDLPGRYAFVFQPAEEGGMGAKAMIDGGLLDGLDATRTIGCHLAGPMPVGWAFARRGVQNAEAHFFDFHLHGEGGHAAMGGGGGNVLVAAAELVTAMGEVVADLEFDGASCVCAPGTIHAGTASNVVPRHAHVSGTIRTFSDDQTRLVVQRLDELERRLADSHGVEIERITSGWSPAVVNDTDCVDRWEAMASEQLGADFVWTQTPPIAPADDMSEFLARMPGIYFNVGANAEGTSGMHHTPEFTIDERSLTVGAKLMALGAVDLALS